MRSSTKQRRGTIWVVLVAVVAATGVWMHWAGKAVTLANTGNGRSTGGPQLVSVEPMSDVNADGEMCEWAPASAPERMREILQREMAMARPPVVDSDETTRPITVDRMASRVIKDPYPTYSSIAMDPITREIFLQDENLYQIITYDHDTNTPKSAMLSEPKRSIGGHKTKVEFNCALYIDPKSGDIYSVNNDTLDTMVIFSRGMRGDVPPTRELRTPHRTYGIVADEVNDFLYITVQDPPMIVIYPKNAKNSDKPARVIRGNKTKLADAHGIALDPKRKLLFVANYGNTADYKDGGGTALPRGGMLPGSGRYEAPSITVYNMEDNGNVEPVHQIVGKKTMLNWPAHMYYDDKNEELYVANDGDNSVLVFKPTDTGDIAPTRFIKGPKSQIKNPTGVVVDLTTDEIFVSNMGNHSATVYTRTASGDAPPKRVIRAAPVGAPALQIGNPGAVAYDTKRDQILVPN
jgi:DNA-binding beta-propeller fold protein YncE